MSYTHYKENQCLIVSLAKADEELSSLKALYTTDCKHLILDLRELLDLNKEDLTKFTTFGKKLVNTNSFVMISNQFFHENFLVVPTLTEAFDIIEMEDIERSL